MNDKKLRGLGGKAADEVDKNDLMDKYDFQDENIHLYSLNVAKKADIKMSHQQQDDKTDEFLAMTGESNYDSVI